MTTERIAATNSNYKKLAVQWLNKAYIYFVLKNPEQLSCEKRS